MMLAARWGYCFAFFSPTLVWATTTTGASSGSGGGDGGRRGVAGPSTPGDAFLDHKTRAGPTVINAPSDGFMVDFAEPRSLQSRSSFVGAQELI